MKKFAIFDLDGTLMDTIEDLNFAMNEMLREMKYPEITREQVRAYIGNGAREFVRLSVAHSTSDEATVDECLRIYRRIYDRESTKRSKVFAGILPALDDLKSKGVRLAVLSNKPDFATNAVISEYFGNRFEVVMGQREGIPVKPDPAGVRLVLESLGALPEETVFIGDGETDFLTAKAAGLSHIAVLWGYRTREELSAHGAEVFAETPAEMERLILK